MIGENPLFCPLEPPKNEECWKRWGGTGVIWGGTRGVSGVGGVGGLERVKWVIWGALGEHKGHPWWKGHN